MTSAALLENIAETAANQRAEARYAARVMLRSISSLKRVRGCGLGLGQEVRLRGTCAAGAVDGGIAGLATCGSPWACPVCASKIGLHRTDELERGITSWAAAGGRFALLTLTMRHHRGHKLGQLWDGLSDAWRRFGKDGSASRARKALGVSGFHRTTEVTYGSSGWHVHLHVLYFLEPGQLELTARASSGELVARWIAAVEASGFEAVAAAQDWKVLRGNADALKAVAGYVIKNEYRERESSRTRTARDVALEVARSDIKTTRAKGSRAPFEILADITTALREDGVMLEDELRLWREWETDSKGRRQQVWSRGMRDKLELGAELTDDEAAELEIDGEDLVAIDSSEWRRVSEADPALEGQLRAVIRSSSSLEDARSRLTAYLTARGVKHRPVWPVS